MKPILQWLKNFSRYTIRLYHKIDHIFSRKWIWIWLIIWWLVFFTWINDRIIAKSGQYIHYQTDTLPTWQAVMILWASVFPDGRLSQVVQDRANKAIDVRKSWKVASILVSADNSTSHYDETRTIKKYLVTQWIPESAIFQDFAWFDTYDSMYRARDIFKVNKLIISTQSFHQPRAVWIARELWLDADWIVADRRIYRDQLRTATREFFARVKAWINVIIGSKPRFLWPAVPITWESNANE